MATTTSSQPGAYILIPPEDAGMYVCEWGTEEDGCHVPATHRHRLAYGLEWGYGKYYAFLCDRHLPSRQRGNDDYNK